MGVKVYHNGSWIELSNVGSATAGGNDKQIQFNDGGNLAGAANLEFQKSTTSPKIVLKPSDTSTSTNGGAIFVENANDSNHVKVSADGGIEIRRSNDTAAYGGPYLDFTYQDVDMDARIQMEHAATGGGASHSEFSSIKFENGGGGSTNGGFGNVTEKFRITKAGDLVLAHSHDNTRGNTVLGGGIYTRSKRIAKTAASTTTPFFQITSFAGAVCGTAYVTCSHDHNSQSQVYHIALHYKFGTDSGAIVLAADGSGYPPAGQEGSPVGAPTNTMSMGVATSTNVHTISVNTAGANFNVGTGVLVNVTLFLGASHVPITVTRP